MASDFPYVYPYSRAEARRIGETQMHEDSFRENVKCARAVEGAIREHFRESDEVLTEGCAQSVLEAYGFKRVCFVLSNSLREMARPYLIGEDARNWAKRPSVPPDGKYNRYFAVDTAAVLLESFYSSNQGGISGSWVIRPGALCRRSVRAGLRGESAGTESRYAPGKPLDSPRPAVAGGIRRRAGFLLPF